MQFMRARDVPETSRDLVFRTSRLHAITLVVVIVAGCTYMVLRPWPPRPINYYAAGGILFLLYLLRNFVIRRCHPSNWLVRTGDEGLFIHYRSYLNEDYSADDPTVVFLPYSEIRSARIIHEHKLTPTAQGGTQVQFLKWVEFELAVDPAPLADALSAEFGHPLVPEKHWYGTTETVYQDYPVLMQTPPFLRVLWSVVPRVSVFLDAIRQRVEIVPPVTVKADYAHLQSLLPAEQEKKLREMQRRGETIAAVYMARRLHGSSLAEANDFVKKLAGGPQS